MPIKRIFLVLLTVFLSLAGSRSVFAEDTPKSISLGLDVAKAIVSEKDVSKALKSVAKDEYTSWLWDSVGGMEKFITQNSEADIPVLKDKIMDLVGIVESIEKFSIAMTEGKYDDAAFVAIDQVVGKINHPLVSLTWEMAKLTYESHKAVQASGNALKVERLYGLMSNDRRLMGTIDPDSDSPALIPETAASADYFFNKYVMTDDGARAALQAYVTTVLNEDWPEESWSEWIGSFAAIGSGTDTRRSAELEMLGGEWRNKGRTWIMKLIKEVNMMAKQAWAEARLRQQMVEFKKFSDRVGHFYNGDFAQMLREFASIKKIEKEITEYPKYLAESQKQRAAISAKIGTFKPTDISLANGFLKTAEPWYYKCLSYASRAEMVNEKGLASSFMQERSLWEAVVEQLERFIDDKKEKIVDNVERELEERFATGYSDQHAKAIAAYSRQYFSQIKAVYLIDLEWSFDVERIETPDGQNISVPSDPDAVKDIILAECNTGNIGNGGLVFKTWQESAQAHYRKWAGPLANLARNGLPVPKDIIEKKNVAANMRQQAESASKPLYAKISGLQVQARKLYDSLRGASSSERARINSQYSAIWSQIHSLYRQISAIWQPTYAVEREIYYMSSGWNHALRQGREAAKQILASGDYLYNQNIEIPSGIVEVFSGLKKARVQEYKKLEDLIDYVKGALPYDIEETVRRLEENFKRMGEEAHTYIVPVREVNPSPLGASGYLSAVASQISNGGIAYPSQVMGQKREFEKKFSVWQEAITLWQSTPSLEPNDILEIEVLVKPEIDIVKATKDINERIKEARSAPARINKILNAQLQLAERDRENRDKDSYWLIEKSRVVARFFREQFDKNRLSSKNGFKVVLPGIVENGMVRVNDPYPHYLTKEEVSFIATPIINDYNNSPALAIMSKYLPDHHAAFMHMLTLPGIKGAEGENFFVRNEVVYVKDVEKAEKIINKMKASDKDYNQKMAEISKLLPLVLNAKTDKEMTYHQNKAKLYKLSFEEYQQKMLKKPLSQDDYTIREIDWFSEDVNQHEWGKKYIELREILKKIVDEHRGAAIIERQRIAEQKAKEEVARRQEAENRKALAESDKMLNNMDKFQLSGFYGYSMLNPRLNSRSLTQAFGDVILTKSDLLAGKLNITGRLFTIDKAEEILLSDDGGRSWQALNLSAEISFSIDPMPNKSYDFILRIKTVDGREPQIKIFNNVRSFVFLDVSFEQLVVDAVGRLADSYEQTNLGIFAEYISQDYLGNKATLLEGVRFDFDMFNDIRLKIYINRIEQRGAMFVAETKWDKTQTPRTTGQQQRTSGKTTFMFVLEGGMLKIKNLRGDLIYATLSPEIAQSSGKNSAVVDQIRTARNDRNPIQPGAATTEDSGGLTTTTASTETLTTKTATLIFDDGTLEQSIDFSADNVSNNPALGDANLFFDEFDMHGSAKIASSATEYDSLSTAPGVITDSSAIVTAGQTYAFVTDEGYYGKMKVTSFTIAASVHTMQFKYAVQLDGTTNLATQ
ncbi:MAG: hypothetical protein PHV17_01945 [Candidatus Omnitrophica bacterium]|nr:hypothetical protein [Candidatus Omnitrophota bacterium]